jgi:hypothetical protein
MAYRQNGQLPDLGNVFDQYVRDRVRAAIMNIAEPVINEAVNQAMAEFKTSIEQWRDVHCDRIVVNIMASKKDAA